MRLLWLTCLTILVKTVSSETNSASYRLSRNFFPKDYHLTLIPDLHSKKFTGTVVIAFESAPHLSSKTKLNQLELNSVNLKINPKDAVLRKGHKNVKFALKTNNEEKLIIEPVKPFKRKVVYKLTLHFDGELSEPTNNTNSNSKGFILSSYTDEKGNKRKYVFGNFFPSNARSVFPCFDEPSFKAYFTLTIGRQSSYTSLSTTTRKTSKHGKDSKGKHIRLDTFRKTDPIAPASLSLLVSQLSLEKKGKLNIWAPTKRAAKHIAREPFWNSLYKKARRILKKSLPIDKLNYVFIPDLFQTTISSLGVIYIKGNNIIHYLSSEERHKGRITNLLTESLNLKSKIAKALITQYFGDISTPPYWDEVWLRNSISEHYGDFIAHQDLRDIDAYKSGELRTAVLDNESGWTKTSPIIGNFTKSTLTDVKNSITEDQARKVKQLFKMDDPFKITKVLTQAYEKYRPRSTDSAKKLLLSKSSFLHLYILSQNIKEKIEIAFNSNYCKK